MLNDQDLMDVQEVCRDMQSVVTIVANPTGGGTPFETDLMNIARQVSGVSNGRIALAVGAESLIPGMPSLVLSDGLTQNIHYFAAPTGRELPPFLDALSLLGKAKEPPLSQALRDLDTLSLPVHVLVAVAPTCPHCPVVVRSALGIAVGRPLITVVIADVLELQDLATRYKVKSTPTVVINEGMTLVGQVSTDELVGHVLGVGRADSLTAVLDSMIKSGRAEDAADLMCREKQPEAIIPLFLSQEFSTRMGALVVMEEALSGNPRSLDPIVDRLTTLLFQDEVALRGDTAELLGKIGNPSAIPALERVLEDADPDVREAAMEALEAIRGG